LRAWLEAGLSGDRGPKPGSAARRAPILIALLALLCTAFSLQGCATPSAASPAPPGDAPRADAALRGAPWLAGERSRYRPPSAEDVLFINATLLDGAGGRIDHGRLLLRGGVIVALGTELPVPPGVQVVDAAGRWITPGIVDVHSHAGVIAAPFDIEQPTDVNEPTDVNTAHVWAEHSFQAQDPSFGRLLAAGVTSLQVLPGSSNLFGGRSVVVRNVPGRTVYEMMMPGAPQGLKMACGSNPKGHYGAKGRFPASRMGVVAGQREAWLQARQYHDDWQAWLAGERGRPAGGNAAKPPARDLRLDTLAGVLAGDITVHAHCYRADDMAHMIEMAREFGFRIAAFHHAVEAYKIAGLLADAGICAAVWSDWSMFKAEAVDGLRENAAILDLAGACVMLHSDVRGVGVRMNIEAAKAMSYGRRAGLDIPEEHAIRWITSEPAKLLGISNRVGTLAPGMEADIVVWSGHPFSVYSWPERVYVHGALLYEHDAPGGARPADFELGQPAREPVP
jgi:imidazolonepropionase-like amidohydrolase